MAPLCVPMRYPSPDSRADACPSSAAEPACPVSTNSITRTAALPACSRCRRPAYCWSVLFHDTGIASIKVSSGGWSKPSPISLPVASNTRGAFGGKASSAAISTARCLFAIRPCYMTACLPIQFNVGMASPHKGPPTPALRARKKPGERPGFRIWWWRGGGSNSRPLHCERSALPAELPPRTGKNSNIAARGAGLAPHRPAPASTSRSERRRSCRAICG